MSFRITTNGTMYKYQSNLMRSRNKLNDSMEKVLTGREFNSYAEDPAAASKAFQLRRSMWRTEDQITNTKSVINSYQSAWSVIDGITNGEDVTKALEGLNDPTASGRQPLGQTLLSAAEGIVRSMNTTYAGRYLFAGSDGLNVPFSFDANGGLQYRGISVDTEDADELQKLDDMNKETTYVDLGLGMAEDDKNNIMTSSVFNSALSGIDFLGYGKDADGDPKNIVSLMKELGDIFSRCDSETGNYETATDQENANRLTGKLQDAMANLTTRYARLDGDAEFLNSNLTRLTSNSDTLNEQILDLEDIDPAKAITDMSYAQYSYNAALKIGNNILSQSLLDYMN